MRIFLILFMLLSSWAAVGNDMVSEPDFEGIKRDTWYFLGYQAAAVGILYLLPEEVSGWSDEAKEEFSFKDWCENVKNPTWDKDKAYINYIIHPYWGASYYVRARERGYNNTQSFWYSVLLSTMFEFGFEALFEQPSIQDLVVTPVLGSMLGAYFMRVRESVKQRNAGVTEVSTGDKLLLIATDPLGGLNRAVDKMIGRDAEVTLSPFVHRNALLQHEKAHARNPRDLVTGFQLTLRF